jgi:hypothetical protein
MARKREFFIGGPCAVFTSLFASCARSTLSKIEKEASSDTGSADALLRPAIDIKETTPAKAIVREGRRRIRTMISLFITDNLFANQPSLQI